MPKVKQTLSPHAVNCLESIFHKPKPSQNYNPGVVNQLMKLGAVEIISLPSPFPSHKEGTKVDHLQITELGKTRARKWAG